MSSLQPIPYQPIDFEYYPELDTCADCDDSPQPCVLFGPSDPVSFQLRNDPQTYDICTDPCSTDPACVYFTNNVSTCSGAGEVSLADDWVFFSSCTLRKSTETAESIATVSLGALPNPSRVIRYTINLANVTSGSLKLRVGTLESEPFTTSGTAVWTTYVDLANVSQPLELVASLDFLGDVTLIKGEILGERWQVEGDGWYFDADYCGWRHRTTAPQQSYSLTYFNPLPANVYKVTVRVEDANALQSFVTFQLGYFSQVLTTNGTFVFYVDLINGSGAGSSLSFTPSVNFDGIVSLLALETSTRGHLAVILDENGNQYAALAAPYYEGDFVTWSAPDWQALQDANGDPISPGCYTVGVYDGGDLTLGQYLNDPTFTGTGAWTIVNEGGTDLYQSAPFQALALENFSGRVVQALGAAIDPTKCYRLHVEILPAFTFLGTPLPVSGDILVLLNSTPIAAYNLTSGVSFDVTLNGLNPGDTLTFEIVNATCAFYRAQLFDCAPFLTAGDATYVSNCVALQTTVACDTNFVEGQVPGAYFEPQLGTYVSPVAFGLQFNPNLRLGLRAPVYFLNPTGDGDDSSYDYRNGRKQRTAASTQHNWELVIGGQGAIAHGALETIMRCPQVQISKNPVAAPGPLYVVLSDDYAPNWAKGSRVRTADVSLDVTRLEKSRRYLRRTY